MSGPWHKWLNNEVGGAAALGVDGRGASEFGEGLEGRGAGGGRADGQGVVGGRLGCGEMSLESGGADFPEDDEEAEAFVQGHGERVGVMQDKGVEEAGPKRGEGRKLVGRLRMVGSGIHVRIISGIRSKARHHRRFLIGI